MAAQGFPVADELDAVQAGCNAAVAVGVIGVEVHGHAGVAAGIEQGSIHRIRVLIHHVGLFVRLGGDEPAAGVGGIIRTLQVTVAQGAANRLEGRQNSLVLELVRILQISGADACLDPGDGVVVRLRDDGDRGMN